ncbi:hypothetical protein N9V16_02800 [SAR116 cluster bacterium]|nr:hypothetical protein [SAR116 cluster bacterium]
MTLRELGYSFLNLLYNLVSYILDAFITMDRDFYDLEIGQVFILLVVFGVVISIIVPIASLFFDLIFGTILKKYLDNIFVGFVATSFRTFVLFLICLLFVVIFLIIVTGIIFLYGYFVGIS